MTPLLSALAGDEEIAALLSDEAALAAMLAAERALAEASAEAGWIAPDAAGAVGAAVAGFAPDWADLNRGMARDGVVVPALVGQLRAGVAEPHRAALHKGATSQDIIDTALMIQLAGVFGVLEARRAALVEALEGLAAREGDRALMAHTRMQVALPTRWGFRLEGWAAPLRRLAGELAARRAELAVQLGGPVGDGESFDGHRDAIAAGMARRLGLALAAPWQTGRDRIAAIGQLFAQVSGALGKIGADVALLAQNEVGAIRLEGGGGSSAMAHKSNPVAAEVLVALARQNAGLSGTLNQALVHEYERSGAAWTLEWLTLPQMAVAAGASLRLGLRLVGQLRLV